jgi:tetrahydromethanopterin S-methyltransferase subunit C
MSKSLSLLGIASTLAVTSGRAIVAAAGLVSLIVAVVLAYVVAHHDKRITKLEDRDDA